VAAKKKAVGGASQGKNVDYVTILIPESYLVIPAGYSWCKIEDVILHHTH